METELLYYQSPIGILEICSSNKSITAIHFINSRKGSKIKEEAIIFTKPSSAILKLCIQQLNEYFEGNRKIFSFSIEQEGTPFQQQVWQELRNIPFGKTISYLELSKRIGNVKAIRAVGTANGNNHISIIIPCHRVIGSNGNLIGYGGDLWRKKWLLDHEGKYQNGIQKLF